MARPRKKPISQAALEIKNKYDAAGTGRRMKGWNPPATGPNKAIVGIEKLRARSRDSSRNDWSGESINQKWVTNLIGVGTSASNGISYETPSFNGLRAKVQLIHGENPNGNGAVGTMNAPKAGNGSSYHVYYAAGPLSAGPGLEPGRPEDQACVSSPSRRTALPLRMPGMTSGLKPATSKSFIQRSGVMSG